MVTQLSGSVDVLVVGAGPTGLTAALALDAAGVAVRIVDRNPGPVRESRALVVQARTLELWHKLGLAEHAVTDGQPVRGARVLLDGRPLGGGRLLVDLTQAGTGRTPYPFVLVYEQDRVERLLVDALAARGIEVERSTEAVGLTQDADGVDVTLERGGERAVVRARYLVGADGAHSVVRRAAGIAFDGDRYDGAFFLADVAIDGPVAHDALTVALGRRGEFVLLVPMRDRPEEGGRSRFRVFGSLDPAATADDVTLAEAQAQVDRVTRLRTRLHDPRWLSVYRLSHRIVDSFRAGRVLLAGDAAHVHSPVGGQGMNTGIQDAYDLAWMVADVLHEEASEALLDAYDAERRPVARALLEGTDGAFRAVTRDAVWLRVARVVGGRVAPVVLRLPALQRRLFRTISQVGIAYPESPAVGGPRVRVAWPGERAPFAMLADGSSLFDLLTGPGHHLLVIPGEEPLDDQARDVVGPLVEGLGFPVRVHALEVRDAEVRRAYGVRTPTAVLIRPDGVIATRTPLTDHAIRGDHAIRSDHAIRGDHALRGDQGR